MRAVALVALGIALMTAVVPVSATSAPAAWVVFVDDLHLQFRNTGRVRDLVRNVLARVVQPGDLMALRASGPSAVGNGALASPDLYRPLVSRITGNGLRDEDLLRTDPATAADIQARFLRAMSMAILAMDAFQSAGDAPRGLILISNGYSQDPLVSQEGDALARTAIRNSVKVFAISGGFIASNELPLAVNEDEWAAHLETSRNSLRHIAERTGGFAILTAWELPTALERIRIE